jgi:hypothetical protein
MRYVLLYKFEGWRKGPVYRCREDFSDAWRVRDGGRTI